MIILEDDLDFEAGFINSFRWLITEADTVVPDWELMYVHSMYHITRDG